MRLSFIAFPICTLVLSQTFSVGQDVKKARPDLGSEQRASVDYDTIGLQVQKLVDQAFSQPSVLQHSTVLQRLGGRFITWSMSLGAATSYPAEWQFTHDVLLPLSYRGFVPAYTDGATSTAKKPDIIFFRITYSKDAVGRGVVVSRARQGLLKKAERPFFFISLVDEMTYDRETSTSADVTEAALLIKKAVTWNGKKRLMTISETYQYISMGDKAIFGWKRIYDSYTLDEAP